MLMRQTAMMKTVIRTQEDIVIVFDENGRQIPEYQGRYEDVRLIILQDAFARTVFKHWRENSPEPEIVARNNW